MYENYDVKADARNLIFNFDKLFVNGKLNGKGIYNFARTGIFTKTFQEKEGKRIIEYLFPEIKDSFEIHCKEISLYQGSDWQECMEKVKKDIREKATTKFNYYLNSIASQGFDLNDFIFTFGMGLRRFFIIMMNEAMLMKHDLAEAYTQYLKDFKLKLMEKTRKFIEDDGGKEMLETFMANTVGEAVNVTKSRLAGFDVFESIGDDLKNGILTMGEEKTFTSVRVVPFTRFINERESAFQPIKNSINSLSDEEINKDVRILSSLLTDIWEGKLTAEQAVKEFEKKLKETRFEAKLKEAREELSSYLKGLGIGEEEKKAYMKIIGLDIDTMAETEKKMVRLFKESAEAVALKKENTEEVAEIMSDFKEKCKREISDLKVRIQERLSAKEEVFGIVQKFWNTGFGEITLVTEYDPEKKQLIEVERENNRKWLTSEFGGEDKMTEEEKRKLYAGSEILKWDGMTKMGLLLSGAVDAYRKELSDILEERKKLGLEIKKDRDGSYILTEDERVRLENAVRRYFQEKTDLILGSGNKEKGKAFRSVLAEIYNQYISQEIKRRLDARMREPDVKKKFQERVKEKKREKLEPLIKEKEKEIRERVKEKFLEEKKYVSNKELSDEEKKQMEEEIERELIKWKSTELAKREKEIEREVYKGIRAEEYKRLLERIKRGEEELPDKIFSGGNTPEAKVVSRLFKEEVISSAERIKGITARASFAIGETGENLTGISLDHLSLSNIKLSEEKMGDLNELMKQSNALLNKEEEYYQNQLKIQKAFESEWTKTEEARKRVRTDLKEGGEKLKNLAERLAFFTTVAMTYHPNLMKEFISFPVDKNTLLPLLKMGEEKSIIENEFLKRLYIDKNKRIDDWEKIKEEVNERAKKEYEKRYGKLSIEDPLKLIKKKMDTTQIVQEEVKRFWEIKKEIYLEMLDNMGANREEVEKKIQEIEKRDNPKKFSPSSYLYALSLAGASINAKKLISAFGNMVDKSNFREIESFLLREGIMSEDGEISIKSNTFNFLKMVSENKKNPFLLKEMWKNFKSEVEYTEGVTKLTREIREVLSGKKSLKDFVFRNQMSGDTDKKLIERAGKRMGIILYDPQNPEKFLKDVEDISDSTITKDSDIKKKEKKGRDKDKVKEIAYNPVLDMANRFTKLLLQLIEKEEEKKETEAVKNLGDKILKGKEQLEEKRLLSRFVKKFRKNNNNNNNNSPKPKPPNRKIA